MAQLPASQVDTSARIDRRDLAHDLQVWRIYGAMFAIVGIASLVIPVLWPGVYDRARLWPFAAALLAVSATTWLTDPPRVRDPRNHLVILTISVMSAIGVVVYAPSSMAPATAAVFVGTFAAGRLIDRRWLLLHYTLATICLLLPIAVAPIDQATVIAIISVIPGIWVLGWCTTLILEAAEGQSRELASLVRRDPLTGVGNRRLLDETLATELPRHAESGESLSVFALDLNGFKALNDGVGHDAGDALLVAVAAALSSVAREEDVVVRQGGDEFCLLFPRTGGAHAGTLRARIDAVLAAVGDGTTPVTSGIGIATFPEDGTTAAELLAVADARLAEDKAEHRALPRSLPAVIALPGTSPAPTTAPGALTGTTGAPRVSRRMLAMNLTVWRGQGVLVALYAAMLGGVALVTLEDADPQRSVFAICLLLGAIAYFTLRREPPAIGTALNHVVVSLPYVGATCFMVASPSIASAALGPLALSGSLAAVRLVDRRQIGAHLVAATLCSFGLIAAGIGGVPMVLALALIILVNWGGAGGAMIYLERSEAQGDELERLVRRDPLTGVGNRRLLSEQLMVEEQRFALTNRPFTVLALDLNGFKGLNDTLGHGAGDALLRDVAEALQAVTKPGDTLVRQGGDEFCLVLPETDAAEAIPAANAARAAVAGLSRDGHRITTGVGIATYPTDARTPNVLLYVADERLRHDKETGPPHERRAEPRVGRAAVRPLEVVEDPADTGTG